MLKTLIANGGSSGPSAVAIVGEINDSIGSGTGQTLAGLFENTTAIGAAEVPADPLVPGSVGTAATGLYAHVDGYLDDDSTLYKFLGVADRDLTGVPEPTLYQLAETISTAVTTTPSMGSNVFKGVGDLVAATGENTHTKNDNTLFGRLAELKELLIQSGGGNDNYDQMSAQESGDLATAYPPALTDQPGFFNANASQRIKAVCLDGIYPVPSSAPAGWSSDLNRTSIGTTSVAGEAPLADRRATWYTLFGSKYSMSTVYPSFTNWSDPDVYEMSHLGSYWWLVQYGSDITNIDNWSMSIYVRDASYTNSSPSYSNIVRCQNMRVANTGSPTPAAESYCLVYVSPSGAPPSDTAWRDLLPPTVSLSDVCVINACGSGATLLDDPDDLSTAMTSFPTTNTALVAGDQLGTGRLGMVAAVRSNGTADDLVALASGVTLTVSGTTSEYVLQTTA